MKERRSTIRPVVTLTMSPAVDQFTTTPSLNEDAKSRCRITAQEPGGGGINVARNLRRLGVDVLAVFPGGGFHGRQLEQLLADEGLPHQCIPIAAETTRNLALTEESSSRQFHLVFPGARLQEPEWLACLNTIAELTATGGHLVISGSLPPGVPDDFLARVIVSARQREVKVILDTSGAGLEPALNAGVHLAKLNREEFAQLGYTGSGDPASRLDMMSELVDRGMAELLIVTIGPDGALLASRDGLRLHASPPPTTVVSHVGAGDAFVSVMTWQLYRDQPVDEAFRYGVAAAAAAISSPGSQLPDRDLLERMYQQTGHRML